MQVFDPICNRSRFRIQTSSPIQELRPTANFHGQWIFTWCRTITPAAILAPNNRSTVMRTAFGHHHFINNPRDISHRS
jgi:hypothetical protein